MRKSILTLAAVGVFAFVGCNQVPDVMSSNDDTVIAAKGGPNGVSAPGTPVGATFTVTIGDVGGTAVQPDGPARNAQNGWCTGGVFTNNGGNEAAGTPPHQQCLITVEPTIVTVTISGVLANYVVAPNGNINLNFQTCGNGAECEDTFVHYRANRNQNDTRGNGSIFGNGDDGSVWAIDLGQINHSGNAQIAARELTGLVATSDNGLSASGVVLTW